MNRAEYFTRVYGNLDGHQLKPTPTKPTWNEAFTLPDPAPRYDPTVPLVTQLARVFALDPSLYTPSNNPHHNDHLLGTTAWRRRFDLGVFALQALEAEYLHGKFGLEFISSDIFLPALEIRLNRRVNSVVFHGSPEALDVIEPRQANWQDPQGRRYVDGRVPSIRASADTEFPVIRAILHEGRPELADVPLILSKQKDQYGRTYWVTSEEALEAARGLSGYVYVIDPQKYSDDGTDPYYDAQKNEHVITGRRRTLARVRVSVDDLPPLLCVVSAADRDKLRRLQHYKNPREFGDIEGIEIRPFGGMWPTGFFPGR